MKRLARKAIKYLTNLQEVANVDKDGDVFFCKEYDFHVRIQEMIDDFKTEDDLTPENH